MPQLSTLITGAGVVTPITGQSQMDNYLVIGGVSTAMPLQSIQVDVGNETIINIQQSQPLCSAFAKYLQRFTATLVGIVIKLGTGRIYKPTNIRLTNNGVTTPAIYSFSDGQKNAFPFRAVSDTINAASSKVFKKFSAIMITPAANLGSVDVTFNDGFVQNFIASDLDALFSTKYDTDANGRLDPVVTTIDNSDQSIREIKINTTTAVTVLVLNFSDDDFTALRAAAVAGQI